MKQFFPVFLFFICTASLAQKEITIDDFTTRNAFAQRSVYGINWMNDGKHYTTLEGNKIVKYAIATGQAVETLADGNTMNPKINFTDYELSSDEKKILLLTGFEGIYRRSFKAEYFVYDLNTRVLRKLSEGGKQSYAAFSPDGSKVAFVRQNNLFYVDLNSWREVQITTDGKLNKIINGTTDWGYEEEFSFVQAFYWSPDSRRLAYHRFDESNVRQYTLQKWNKGALYPEDYVYKYPKAGEANSVVEIWIYDLQTNSRVKADIGEEKDIYIPRVIWTANPTILSIRRLNRLQNQLDIIHTDAATGKSTVVLTERNTRYVDVEYCDDLTYLMDGKHFIHASEESGFKHLYLYTVDGKKVNQITSGNWEVIEFLGVDEKNKIVYYISNEGNHLHRNLYAISLDGKRKTALTSAPGTHTVDMGPDYQYYLDYYSHAEQPLQVSLYQVKGNKLVRVLERNEELQKKIIEYGLVSREFFTYLSADGKTQLDATIMKPRNFDANRKYPVMVFQYSGPRAPSVRQSFAVDGWAQLLVQKGYLVVTLDTRGSGYRGEEFVKQTYKQMGSMELEDLLAGGRYLASLPYVDGSRLGIYGWSYGGFMASLVMTKGAGVYKLGIAGAPVTSWKYYDNIYTERYMQRPQDNPSGYEDNSPIKYADRLSGHFLLIHGTGDDNVHVQNSMALQDALIMAGKQFRSFYYPDDPHGIRGARRRHHLYTLMTDFILQNL
ncbi:MAG: S9 family peptidase [Cyclobacteriaceae bacterium]|nr:S9 family peptidase [Cyclobacteriaceae bacterium]